MKTRNDFLQKIYVGVSDFDCDKLDIDHFEEKLDKWNNYKIANQIRVDNIDTDGFILIVYLHSVDIRVKDNKLAIVNDVHTVDDEFLQRLKSFISGYLNKTVDTIRIFSNLEQCDNRF